MSGKKGKKTKGKPISLQEFLGDTPVTLPTLPKIKSWADSTEDDDDYGGYSSRPREPIILPTAPRSARDMSVNEENIPSSPPFVAYISNLPYDVEEEDLIEFFQDMKVSSMRLPKDGNKFKGYGYVDFEDRQSLIDALSMIDTNLKSRRVRIEVSNNTSDDRRGRMGRMGDSRRDYGDDPERTTGDWRSARMAANDNGGDDREDRYRSRFSNRDDNRDSGFEDNKPGNWRDAPRSELAERPRPSYRDSRGPGGPGDDRGESRDWNRFADRTRGPPRDGSRERDGERAGSSFGNRDRDGERGGSSFGPRRTYGEDTDRERWGSLRSQPREPISDGPPASDAPRTRPKLALQPRTKPVEAAPVIKDNAEDAADEDEKEKRPPAPAPVPAANIFGAAKPVDTAAREREIEERLAKTAEARKEETDPEKRGAPREGAWGRRNGEGREDSDRSRPTWRSGPRSDDKDNRDRRDYRDSREPRGDSRGSSGNRGGPTPSSQKPRYTDSRPPPDGAEKKKDREEDEVTRTMPKAKDDQAPNFVASNVYSMLPDDIDPDNIEE
ncbi:hypothetical protein TSAR_009296 [Trichomalopsis sarcophagae]|uniref:RRM domain-containing protein n=1 Tax=Trichomalopsis sarcophagae TaxID=543379 RepID=A0A232FG34_9HYME|nr:hypothetical protein TSAR_009296 [Trichomalopsis sarcophagae]